VSGVAVVIEDDDAIGALVGAYLEQAGFEVVRECTGIGGLEAVERRQPRFVVLDLGLPDVDGFDLCRRLRGGGDIPLLILTARDEEADRIVGLELGADDYITKPFSPNEVVARVRALLRRAHRVGSQPLLRYGPIIVDVERHVVTVGGEPVHLTAKEFLLLQYLLEHQGRVLSRDLLLSDVWGYQYTGGTRTVDVHVRRLREKLPVMADALLTVKQFGYKLAERSE
jgi:two-component system, OmpR family, alkaline phosphatase synthesis response regulator PhoP